MTDHREQQEVLQIFDKINKETGWRIGFVYKELKEKWGWNEEPSPQQFAQTHTAARLQKEAEEARQEQEQEQQLQRQAQAAQQSMQLQQGFSFNQQGMQQNMSMPPQTLQPTPQLQPPKAPPSAAMSKRPPAGIPNPMYKPADFTLPQHPYQNFYTPPISGSQGGQFYYNI